MKINAGCGDDARIGYLNIDIDPQYKNNPNITIADARDLDKLNIADGSVDEIVAIHLIQHFTIDEWPTILQNWIKKLAPGGKIWIQTFDYDIACNAIYHDRCDIGMINEVFFGKNRNNKAVYNIPSLQAMAENLGLKVAEKAYNGFEFEMVLIKP